MIDFYNKNINIPNSILLLMEDIWKLFQDLNIYVCRHVYREANKIVDCVAKKGFSILDSTVFGVQIVGSTISFL